MNIRLVAELAGSHAGRYHYIATYVEYILLFTTFGALTDVLIKHKAVIISAILPWSQPL